MLEGNNHNVSAVRKPFVSCDSKQWAGVFFFFFYDVMISLRTLEMAAECTHLNTTVTRCSEINVSIKKASVPQASDKMYYSTNINMNNKIRQIKKKKSKQMFSKLTLIRPATTK